MNKKDYKSIAEIIKGERKYIEEDKQPIVKRAYALHANRYLTVKLANYFEKEANNFKESGGSFVSEMMFNKKQFLKDCGVEE